MRALDTGRRLASRAWALAVGSLLYFGAAGMTLAAPPVELEATLQAGEGPQAGEGSPVEAGPSARAERRSKAGPLQVGTKSAPPYSYKDAQGAWAGPSIELWKELADRLALDYEFVERDLDGLLRGLESGELDAGVAAITVTSEREERFDFTHPFETSGLGVAVTRTSVSLWSSLWATLSSRQFFQLLIGLGVLQLVVGAAMWALERRHPQRDFEARAAEGIAGGFWWAVVTMTTVGYGDKTPRTAAGRVLALAWMIVSILLISTFTATVASTHTVARLHADIRSPEDLVRLHIGTVRSSTSEGWLRAVSMDYKDFADGPAALEALRQGDIDALVYDRPLLTHLLEQQAPSTIEDIELLDMTWLRQDYAIGVPTGSPLRERINKVLPELLRER